MLASAPLPIPHRRHLSGYARHYRQTVLLSSFASADMNALSGRACANHAGRLSLQPDPPGVLSAVVPQVCGGGGGGGGVGRGVGGAWGRRARSHACAEPQGMHSLPACTHARVHAQVQRVSLRVNSRVSGF
jgi:hypothetical protein